MQCNVNYLLTVIIIIFKYNIIKIFFMNTIYDYIIIGAGIAGITYAYKHKSNNFIILEKNDYIGGRIKNIKWHNTIISLGGGVFQPSHNHILNLCKDFNLKTQEYMSIYHLTDLKGDMPNNKNYYKDFKIIFKSLKKKYFKYETEIKKQNLTFKEFLELYFPYPVAKTILTNSLYSTNFNSDPGLFIKNDFLYGCLRIKDSKMMFIKGQDVEKTGYDFLIDFILKIIDKSNIKLNTWVNEINYNDNLYECICKNKIFLTKKLILATDIKSKIKFNLNNEILSQLNLIYNSIGYEPYIRIYSYHSLGHKLLATCKTQGPIGKTIIINEQILMLCYNESKEAIKLNILLNKLEKQEQIEVLYKLFVNCKIQITKPNDIYIQYWKIGMHYCKPNFNIKNNLNELKKFNIEIIGEIVSESHGWVNSALSTIF